MGILMFYTFYNVLQCIKDIHCCTGKKKIPLAVANVRLPWIPLVRKIQLQTRVRNQTFWEEAEPVSHHWGFESRWFEHPLYANLTEECDQDEASGFPENHTFLEAFKWKVLKRQTPTLDWWTEVFVWTGSRATVGNQGSERLKWFFKQKQGGFSGHRLSLPLSSASLPPSLPVHP